MQYLCAEEVQPLCLIATKLHASYGCAQNVYFWRIRRENVHATLNIRRTSTYAAVLDRKSCVWCNVAGPPMAAAISSTLLPCSYEERYPCGPHLLKGVLSRAL